jgi:hypothetical protein
MTAAIQQVIDVQPVLTDKCHKDQHTQQHLSSYHTTNKWTWDHGISYSLLDERIRRLEIMKYLILQFLDVRHTNPSLIPTIILLPHLLKN